MIRLWRYMLTFTHSHCVPRSLDKLTQALRDQSQTRDQPSSFMKATTVEDLLAESSNKLTQYLGVLNVCDPWVSVASADIIAPSSIRF